MVSRLVKQFEQNRQNGQIIGLLAEGKTYNQISVELKVTRKHVEEVLKRELARVDTPQKILELRDQQSSQIQSHTPRLAQRFIKQSDIQSRLTDRYLDLIEQEEKGLTSYNMFYDQYVRDGLDADEAHHLATTDYNQYVAQREQISKEIERASKLTDQAYKTYLQQQERLAKLHGLDTPQTQQILINRTDTIRVELDEEIKRAQQRKEKNKQQNIVLPKISGELETSKEIEAEIIEDG